MSKAARFKPGITGIDKHLETLRHALAGANSHPLKKSVEAIATYLHELQIVTSELSTTQSLRLATCLDELRIAEKELYAKDQILAEASQELRRQHQRYRDLFEFLPDAYLVVNSKGIIQEANLIAGKMLKVHRDRLLGKPLILFLPRGVEYFKYPFLLPELDSGQVRQLQTLIRPSRGAAFYASIALSVIYDARGMQTKLRLLIRDVTEERQKEAELNESQNQLRALAARLQETREDERNHLARELHDEFGAALTALKLELSWLKGHIAWAVPEIHERMDSMAKLINITIQSITRTATMLRPRLLDDFGLQAAIEWQARDFQERSGIECHLDAEEVDLPTDRATALFRIFQESLTNVARHAEATKVAIILRQCNDHVLFEMRDNGIGLSREKISSPDSLGLLGMRERAYAFGGDVAIESCEGKGTTVKVQIPLARPQPGNSKARRSKSRSQVHVTRQMAARR
ncbi:MAG TPA: ATP-binding protein [Candidatus Acidoferrales bacterium]|nr:ATP-binding protein [Candidatus Acidoferrales bacterium]